MCAYPYICVAHIMFVHMYMYIYVEFIPAISIYININTYVINKNSCNHHDKNASADKQLQNFDWCLVHQEHFFFL
jgi:hypothetical protein